tara:strand:+ start:773872 stop:776325 length:2454 start_codon:yes stop_codon:yes gene_type:complete
MDPKHEQTNQTTDNAPGGRNRSSKKSEPSLPTEMKIPGKPDEDVLDVIEHVESQLGALRKAHEEHRQAMADIQEHKKQLEQESTEIESRESELTAREVELAEMRQDFESRELNLIQRASGLEQRESKIATQAEQLEQQEAELETKDSQLERRIQELDAQLAGISKRKAELEEIEKEVKEKLAREDEAAIKLQAATKELGLAKKSLEDLNTRVQSTNTEVTEIRQAHQAAMQELAASENLHKKVSDELKSAESKLRGREIELGERSHTLEELAEKAGNIELELTTARQEYAQEICELSDTLDTERQASEELRAKIAKLEQVQQDAESASGTQVSELRAELERASAELSSLKAAASEIESQSDSRVSDIATELKASQNQVQELTAQLGEIATCADQELSDERAKLNKLESAVSQLQTQLKEVTDQKSTLESKLAQAIESQSGIDPEELVALQSQVEQANESASESKRSLEESQSKLDAVTQEIAAYESQATESGNRIAELENQSTELFETIEKLGEELETAKASSQTTKIDVDEWNQSRKSRLRKMRKVLAGDAQKIRLATEALRSRYDQCEQVLTKRAELAEAYEAISTAQRKYQHREVRSGVFLGLFGMATVMLALAAISWFVSHRVEPGTYASQATMAAASGNVELSESGMTEWEGYITQLISDPRFIEVAADRMKRRGITEFGVAGDLSKEMTQSLDVASAMPGTVVLEYRGEGALRSQRVLDTFTVALASAANNARARRADSPLTIVESEAQAGAEPLDTRQLEMAGMIFGGSMLMTLIVGSLLWRKLSAAKAKFENDSRVQNLFDESQWQMPS